MYHAIVFLPLIAFLIVGTLGRVLGDRPSQWITCGAVIISAVLSLVAFWQVALGGQPVKVEVASWIVSGTFDVSWSLRIDQLTAVMLVVVNGVSALVHVYSVGYMSHDPHKPRFMAYLSLFTFAMLMLITSDNFLQMFFGWEGVGLASYLLIGFWYHKPAANAAAIKAFLVNRIGDFGFGLGIMATFMVFGSVDFDTVFAASPDQVGKTFHFLSWEWDVMTTICILLFIGAMGKSAQVPLHTWLPDAMEGPTPVSALIHAATMVTAGVFLVARCSPMFEFSPTALVVVTIVGGTTAFFAATVGLVQNDIKRVIAYSTCSQLGYMFFALGVGAYPVAIFHLFTHAFFKALLFLGSGSVIHAMSDEQDMRRMGGIYKYIPQTYIMMWIGSLALAGLPIFAGFYSKDAILESAFAAHTGAGQYAFWLGLAAAVMTAFYSWRLLFMTFHGQPRASQEVMSHVHESPWSMLVPLYFLAAGSILSGILFVHYFVGDGAGAFWGNSIFMLPDNNILEAMHHVPTWVKVAPIVAGLFGILVAWQFYIRRTDIPARLAKVHHEAYLFLLNKWYFDELYDLTIVNPAKWLGRLLWKGGDGRIIDGFGPDGIAATVMRVARRASALQSGYLYHYAFAMLIGVAVLVTLFYTSTGGGH
ncbi:MAG: NADH-quinone oxidoreductase subunit L [Rhodospirillaceae bacterium]|jgi:NADH-quinone oxidoreductase subunit L|nr:NADH-quinone oxidoreductase subunit L [Rhodospirillaceae bacterium]MBT5896100.1 NADH-quinone oxidoreductase subunit L [Rhodospirillaceae bacterium]MBT7756010.1 NADH-quinone oxidoreductase subunit L [Rhodospirillaceae bacterium]